ncbi:helix-turn-helix domain-containing protein [Candidatus Daviesbacteria bacterium]|nr:helix-turn-helix domain-containing protein [Candidatus Daviesbacteria bacterium]
MRTVGQILKDERERKLLKLEEVEKATKIRKELLEALEKDEYHRLPPPTFVQGFIKNYGRFLSLDTEKLLAIYRREFSDRKNPPKIMEAWTNPIDKKRFKITPSKALGAVVFSLIVTFLIYLWIEYRFLVGAPFLEVISPSNQFTTSNAVVVVKGKTDPEAKVMINNQEIQVDISGNFSQEVKLNGSANQLVITSTGKSGKSSRVEKMVFLKP